MKPDVPESRHAIRQKIRALRQKLTPQVQQQQALHLSEKLSLQVKVQQAKAIAIYLANDGELDTQPFINYCWQHNIKTYLPVIHPFSKGHLLFLHYHQQSKMVLNHYGIAEPKLDVRAIIALTSLDIIFTPLVAFDAKGNRLGMGGGFYDRTLSKWYSGYLNAQSVKPYPIGIAHDLQHVDAIPTQAWDIPIPEIFTPSQHFHFF